MVLVPKNINSKKRYNRDLNKLVKMIYCDVLKQLLSAKYKRITT